MLRYTVNTPKIDPSPTLHKITPDKIYKLCFWIIEEHYCLILTP